MAAHQDPLRGIPGEQGAFNAWWRLYLRETFFCPNESATKAKNYAMLARANTHIPERLWRQLRDRQELPAGVPLHCPFAPAKVESWYCQIRPRGAAKQYVHRLAAAAFAEGGRDRLGDRSLEACHRLLTYPGSERDMNFANLYWGSGELNRSQLFCKLLFLRRTGYLHANAYALAVSTPSARAEGAFIRNQAGNEERFQQWLQQSQVPDDVYREAEEHVHGICVEVHTEENRCLFYHSASEVNQRYGLGPIPSIVSTFSAIPDYGSKLENIHQGNTITGLTFDVA